MMKSHTEYSTFHTKKKRELVHLTPRLEEVLSKSGITAGFMFVNVMHIQRDKRLIVKLLGF